MNEVDLSNERKKQCMERRIPMGRIGIPQDIVGPAVFLASPMSSYMVRMPHKFDDPQTLGC